MGAHSAPPYPQTKKFGGLTLKGRRGKTEKGPQRGRKRNERVQREGRNGKERKIKERKGEKRTYWICCLKKKL